MPNCDKSIPGYECPRAYRVILLPEAFDDLDAIISYIEQDSPKNAALTVDRILRAAPSLSELPHRYKVHRSKKQQARTIRSMPLPPFIIYYQIIEQPWTVRVLTIRQARGVRRGSSDGQSLKTLPTPQYSIHRRSWPQ